MNNEEIKFELTKNSDENVSEVLNFIEIDKSRSLASIIEEAKIIQNECQDYYLSDVSLSNLKYDESKGNVIYAPDDVMNADGSIYIKNSPLSQFAFSQLCAKLEVPVRFMYKCLERGYHELVKDNLETYINDSHKNFLIREYKNRVRGVLSDKYSILDSVDILSILENVLDFNQFKVKQYLINEERLHVRLISKEPLPITDEDLYLGILVDSSDVGRSVLTIRTFLYKQICTNGLIVPVESTTMFTQKHIGISADEFRSGFTDAVEKIKESIELFTSLVKRARETPLNDYVDNTDKFIQQRIKIPYGLSDNSSKKVYEVMQEKYSDTQWGLANAITEVAQDFTLERRIELEEKAGKMLLSL